MKLSQALWGPHNDVEKILFQDLNVLLDFLVLGEEESNPDIGPKIIKYTNRECW